MPYFENLSDEKLISLVNKVINSYKKGLSELNLTKFHSNIVDPFSALFETKLGNISDESWIDAEQTRQLQKSLANALGEFHQEVLGSFTGWRSLSSSEGTGIDLEKTDKTAFAEIKNKFNTMNSGSTKTVYEKLEKIANKYPDAKCYLVQILSPKIGIVPFKNEGKSHNRIFIIDGHSFYDLVSGENNTLKKLFNATSQMLNSMDNSKLITETNLSGILQKDFKQNEDLSNYLFRKAIEDFLNKSSFGVKIS